jgi:hypothetical protein
LAPVTEVRILPRNLFALINKGERNIPEDTRKVVVIATIALTLEVPKAMEDFDITSAVDEFDYSITSDEIATNRRSIDKILPSTEKGSS